ncbi:unnamed protein product [Caenorhabditis bovis]|uniref:Ground-like domain-containing protein n=1 Tax=Caenorhabditis bovis TaxID=2654633 RepID=A0A8S1E8D1_9PELO|nr:unnamed protein product [Caenorhabditis bovis]
MSTTDEFVGYYKIFIRATPLIYDYSTSQFVEPSSSFRPVKLVTPYDTMEKRHLVLKRMKSSENVPRTTSACNSVKLANVMSRSMTNDVSVSKRMIQHATKLAFDGAKFDVFCATGEFSYSIHSRKYCEIALEEMTCFAFR